MVLEVFAHMLQPHTSSNITETSSKDVMTVIECKRRRDVFSDSYAKWPQTVGVDPEVMLFMFIPITTLLSGVLGSGQPCHKLIFTLGFRLRLPHGNTAATLSATVKNFAARHEVTGRFYTSPLRHC